MAKPSRGRARQRSIRAAIKRLGVERIEAFLRAAHTADQGCMAVQLINEELDRGLELERALLDGSFDLRVRAHPGRQFEIEFGCNPGPMVGDGGTWIVAFDDEGRVRFGEGGLLWMS